MLDNLETGDSIPSDAFDCVILTQTLPFVYDVPGALRTVHRILRPGGVLLATVPGITPIIHADMERFGQFWSFTRQSMARLLAAGFPGAEVSVETAGNVLSATAFLYGMAVEDLQTTELDEHDPDVELIIGVRARKAG